MPGLRRYRSLSILFHQSLHSVFQCRMLICQGITFSTFHCQDPIFQEFFFIIIVTIVVFVIIVIIYSFSSDVGLLISQGHSSFSRHSQILASSLAPSPSYAAIDTYLNCPITLPSVKNLPPTMGLEKCLRNEEHELIFQRIIAQFQVSMSNGSQLSTTGATGIRLLLSHLHVCHTDIYMCT